MASTPKVARANFAAWRERVASNYYAADPHLASLLRFHDRVSLGPELQRFGEQCVELDALARRTNENEHLPRLARWDEFGNRTEDIEFHPDYHAIGRVTYGSGVISRYAEPGHEFETLAFTYLLGQNGEAGHCCPLACTAGLIKILRKAGDPHGWLQRLLDPNYDTHFHGAQFLTEVQGGSDVGANAVVARPAEAGDGSWRLDGEKYFCSVADAQLMLVTARAGGAKGERAQGTRGVQAFAVPRQHPEGGVNGFALRRLKDKLGTRSMASAEIDFEDAWAWPVGDFKDAVGIVLNTSRLFNAIVSAGFIQRCHREADAYARTRVAFERPILAFPAVARSVAWLRTEAYAARGLSFLLAAVADREALGASDEREQAAWRMLVNLNKFWTSMVGTQACRDAIEILGGNGAIEEFCVLPRMLRDSIVCEQWEGPHNVLCAQVLRDSRRLGLHGPMFEWLAERVPTGHPVGPALEHVRARFERVVAMSEVESMTHVRDVALELRPVAQALALVAEAQSESSDPRIEVVVDHLLQTTAPGYDPLEDGSLMSRIARLNAD